MDHLKAQQIMAVLFAALTVISVKLAEGQIGTPCTTAMISNFTPCANIITGSTNNGTMLSTSCCDSLRSLMDTSMDCACMVISANVPLQLPFNRTLALSLPQACNLNGMAAQCKATGSPLPAPGPAMLGPNAPTPSPFAASPSSPRGSKAMVEPVTTERETLELALAPESGSSSPVQPQVPSKNPGEIRPLLTPPESNASFVSLPPNLLMLVFMGIMVWSTY